MASLDLSGLRAAMYTFALCSNKCYKVRSAGLVHTWHAQYVLTFTVDFPKPRRLQRQSPMSWRTEGLLTAISSGDYYDLAIKVGYLLCRPF